MAAAVLRKRRRPPPAPLPRIEYVSNLAAMHRDELEHLLYFNPQQSRRMKKIAEIIDATGVPRIVQSQDQLRIEIGPERECQAIFALARHGERETLAGVVIFALHAPDRLLILHLAVDEPYTMRGRHAALQVTFDLVDQVRRFGGPMKGVRSVELVYGRTHGHAIDLPVKK